MASDSIRDLVVRLGDADVHLYVDGAELKYRARKGALQEADREQVKENKAAIVDYLRRRQAQKRGGEFEITALPTEPHAGTIVDGIETVQIEKLSEALESLGQIDARLAECVDLKFFCGLSFTEIARLRQVSERTVQRDWRKARTLLNRFIHDQEGHDQGGQSPKTS